MSAEDQLIAGVFFGMLFSIIVFDRSIRDYSHLLISSFGRVLLKKRKNNNAECPGIKCCIVNMKNKDQSPDTVAMRDAKIIHNILNNTIKLNYQIRIFLIGSRARGDFCDKSDTDIAVLANMEDYSMRMRLALWRLQFHWGFSKHRYLQFHTLLHKCDGQIMLTRKKDACYLWSLIGEGVEA